MYDKRNNMGAGLKWRFSKTFSFVFLCLLLLTGRGEAVALEPVPALAEAMTFLELVDAGEYQQAWWEGSEIFHLITGLDAWVGTTRIERELFGDLAERALRSYSERVSQPGLPDGDYVILVFDSRFAHKKKAMELMVMARDLYGDWRAVTYRLR